MNPDKKIHGGINMRIQHNVNALNSHRNLTMNTSAVGKNLEKLSSGYRINRAADDAAGLAISEKMRAQINGLNQAQANAQDGISLIQTAEGALNETHAILQRMRTLAIQASNGTYQTAVDRENIQQEMTALKDEIDRVANSTHYNKNYLINGAMSSAGTAMTLQIGANPTTSENVALTIANMGATALTVSNLSVGTVALANSAVANIDTAIDTVSKQRSALGALQNRLEHTVNNLGVASENLTAAESRIRDVDMAKEMMDFTKNNILTQASQAMLAQANMQPQGVLQLLQ
jgi:flagellin